RQVAVGDRGVGLSRHNRLSAECDAEARGSDHGKIVGPIADRHGQGALKLEPGLVALEGIKLGFAPKNGLDQAARQSSRLDLKSVGLEGIEPKAAADAVCEQVESAGNERAIGTIGLHGGDEASSTWHQRDPLVVDLVEHLGLEPGQESYPLP